METNVPNNILYHEVRDGHFIAYRTLKPSEEPAKSCPTQTPLVLIHGLGGVGLEDWEPLASHLATQREVLIYDHRGIGSSYSGPKQPPAGRAMSIQDMADDASELIQHLGYGSVDLLGFSMGGVIVQQLLIDHLSLPYTIRHAILAASFVTLPDLEPFSDKLSSYDVSDHKPRVGNDTDPGKQFLMSMYSPEWLLNPQNQKRLEMRVSNHGGLCRPMETITQQYQAIAALEQRSALKGTLCMMPILSIHGTEDTVVPIEQQNALSECLPNLEICRLPDQRFGHMWYDYFDVRGWVKIIGDFLAK